MFYACYDLLHLQIYKQQNSKRACVNNINKYMSFYLYEKIFPFEDFMLQSFTCCENASGVVVYKVFETYKRYCTLAILLFCISQECSNLFRDIYTISIDLNADINAY